MAEIKPFRGVRFNTGRAGSVDELICPPYDIISEKQRLGYLAKNPHNIIKIELPVAEDGHSDPYEQAAKTLNEWMDDGVMVRDDKPSLYIYEEQYTLGNMTKSVKGIIALVKLEEFEKGVIMPHEYTLSKPKQDRMNLITATHANISTIYSLYGDEEGQTSRRVAALTERTPDTKAVEEGLVHRLWVVDDAAELAAICSDFADRHLYIADGHHRYETYLKYRNQCHANGAEDGSPCDYVMMLLVNMDEDQFTLFPTHRMIQHAEPYHVEAFLPQIEENFEVEKHQGIADMEAVLRESGSTDRRVMAWYVGNNTWYLLKAKADSKVLMDQALPNGSDALKNLDISILHKLILDRVMHCNNEDCVSYTRIFAEAVASVDEGRSQCCFILNPTCIADIKGVVDAGEKMPQKSTYFYPKPTTGLVVNVFE